MKKYTLADFKTFERDEDGYIICPVGDYTGIKEFPGKCRFGEGCRFGERCRFGWWCRFGEGCNFGKGCRFGERCRFGWWCRFGEGCSFGEECRFGEGCSFGEECRFGEGCSFEDMAVTGKQVRMLQISRIGSRGGCIYFWKHDKGIYARCGCFSGDTASFTAKVEETHKDNPQYLKEYRGAIAYAKSILEG